MGAIYAQTVYLREAVGLMVEQVEGSTEYVTEWVSGGLTMRVRTVRDVGESPEDHAARHQAAVNALLEKYPPD